MTILLLKYVKTSISLQEYAKVICSVQTSCLVTRKMEAHTLTYTEPPLSPSLPAVNRECTAGLTLCSHILTAWVRIQQVDKSYAQHGGKPAAVEWPVKYSLKGQNPILAV